MIIYEVVFKLLNGMHYNELYSDKEKAINRCARMSRNYDESLVVEYIEKDGVFKETERIMHIGEDLDF